MRISDWSSDVCSSDLYRSGGALAMVTRKETGSMGGTMLPQAASYQELTAKFRWQVPEHYNIGVDACDRWAQGKEGNGRLALIHLAEDGRETRYSFGDMKRLDRKSTRLNSSH